MNGQRNDIAEKIKVFWDGEELTGLVSISPTTLEDGIIEVPEFAAIRKIRNGITVMPEMTLVYKLQRDTMAIKFFQDFYLKKTTKDMVKVRCDASGLEWQRTLFPDCECTFYEEPDFDAAAPTYAKVTIHVVPYNVVPIGAE